MQDRKLASIRVISELKSIDGADQIELAIVDGWQVVVKKGEFISGSLCVFFEVDSVLPIREEFEFLRKSCYVKKDWLPNGEGFRLKTIKLRKQLSQGLVIPKPIQLIDASVGDDLTEYIGIVKWDPPIPAQLSGLVKGNFPSFIEKTDQERIQNLPRLFEEERNTKWEVTLKLDGSSSTCYFLDAKTGVCSRNLELKVDEGNENNTFVKVSNESGLLKALEGLHYNIAVQAELMGPGIQGNREGLTEPQLFVFDIYDIDEYRYANPDERAVMFDNLIHVGAKIQHAPIIALNVTLEEIGCETLEKMLEFVNRKSLNHPIAEGCVFKSMDGTKSFKCINNEFLLQEK